MHSCPPVSKLHGRSALLAAIFLLAGSPLLVEASEPETWTLPDIGEPADQILTPQQERHLAKVLRAKLYGELPISEDPEANSYLKALAWELAHKNDLRQKFDILLVEHNVINAFAMPGGVLAFYTGLLLEARTESELAGVIAHEISHVTLRHSVRRYQKLEDSHLSTLGLVAIVLAGLVDTSSVLSTAYLSQAVVAQANLNYTRHHEQEADRVATQYMAAAGIDPHGMSKFFEILVSRGGLSYDDDMVYLSSHPTSPSRLAEARSRADQYQGEFRADSESFHYIRQRLASLLARPEDRLRQDQSKQSAGELRTSPWKYGVAVSHQRRGEHAEALEILNSLHPETAEAMLWVELARAYSYEKTGNRDKSLEMLDILSEKHPANYAVEWYRIQNYMAAGDGATALKLARARVRRGVDEPQTYRLVAEAANLDQQPVAAHMALADFHIRRAEYGQAENQLRLAQAQVKASSANQARIDARRAEILWMQEDKT